MAQTDSETRFKLAIDRARVDRTREGGNTTALDEMRRF